MSISVKKFMAWLEARRKRGYTLESIGDELGVSKQAVFRWLAGATRPSNAVLKVVELKTEKKRGKHE